MKDRWFTFGLLDVWGFWCPKNEWVGKQCGVAFCRVKARSLLGFYIAKDEIVVNVFFRQFRKARKQP